MPEHVHNENCRPRFVFMELSGVQIGEETTGVWCGNCMLPSAIVRSIAILMKRYGEETYERDPVVKLMNLHACEECHTIFELPDVPSLIDNRDG